MGEQALVTMYSRPRCGLCDEAREVILAERVRNPFEYEEISIEGDDDLEREYGIRIPVVLVGGEELFEYNVDPRLFARAVRSRA
ncbi:MAG: glutaredoxin family protein [Actinomycetota bacterium]